MALWVLFILGVRLVENMIASDPCNLFGYSSDHLLSLCFSVSVRSYKGSSLFAVYEMWDTEEDWRR